MQTKTLKELAEYVGATIQGDPNAVITSVAAIEIAKQGQITFISNKKYIPQLHTTKASAVITNIKEPCSTNLLIIDDPYYAFMQIVVLMHGHRKHKNCGISPKASIDKTARIGKNCNIYDHAFISENVTIGDNCTIYPGAFVGPGTTVGNDCILYANAVVYDDCIVGDRVIIQAGGVVGQDGFGFATHKGVHHKIPQIGKAIIEDDVEIGSCAVIERGTISDTVIGKGTKVGDMVAIGHGTVVGPYCLLVPQVGISGSATLGHHCVIAGQAGIVGHIKIGNLVTIGAQAGVINNVPDGSTIVGAPAIDAGQAKRAYPLISTLPEMRKALKSIEKRLNKLEGNE
ncbi:MAG: UDP-3-O-(3-hydroxymyristoyl)glucosamine N-acyltransferase [Phycisphaerae bacterium]|nr:UDP-3-O-(3-hydroxymyristoyl)glucosamine N-acyltransferase [Phycisphaerae bacterium]